MQPPTPLHLLFPPRGTLTPFRRRLPPRPPLPARRYRSSSDGIPGATTATIDDPVEGGDRVVHMYMHGGTHACTVHISKLENHRKNTRKAGLPMFRRGAAATDAPGHRRVPPSFSSFPPLSPGVCVESVCNSLLLSRVATLHATFSTQANSSGNRKFEIEAPHHRSRRAHPRPSFSRITLDHRWSSRAWHQTRGCVIELGK